MIFYIWNPKVHYVVHKNPTMDPFLSQMNPAHNLTTYNFKISSNVILSAMPWLPMRLLTFVYKTKILFQNISTKLYADPTFHNI
jgi:hypothetical protein